MCVQMITALEHRQQEQVASDGPHPPHLSNPNRVLAPTPPLNPTPHPKEASDGPRCPKCGALQQPAGDVDMDVDVDVCM